MKTSREPEKLTTSLSKLPSPVLKLLQALLAHTRPDIDQAGPEVLDADGPNVFGRHVQ
jgi:hypothetical protein